MLARIYTPEQITYHIINRSNELTLEDLDKWSVVVGLQRLVFATADDCFTTVALLKAGGHTERK